MRIKFYIVLVVLMFLSSCKIYKEADLPKQNGLKGYHGSDSTELIKTAEANSKRLQAFDKEKSYLRNSENLNWGLAISGGGIRSASYNLGALKALYDSGILDSLQIISSVSGGGYLSYGLYSKFNIHKASNEKFGYNTFDDSEFLKSVSEQQSRSKFLPNISVLGAVLTTPKNAFNIYSRKIHQLHGHGSRKDLPINALNSYIKDGRIPYFIINTTLASKEGEDWLSSIFEFTPIYMGNPEIGRKYWTQNDTFIWSEATTISAANIKQKLLKEIPNYSDKISNSELALSDGGHSENLGAIALIRRGVKNIIILDATHNIDYSFHSYKKLKRKLKEELQLNLNVKGIDDFIANADSILISSVFKGTIEPIYVHPNHVEEPLKLNIYFVKMSLSQDINNILEPVSAGLKGEQLNAKIVAQTCTKYNRKNECKRFDISQLNDFQSMNIEDLSKYWVKSYATHINNHSVWKRLGYTFPHTTTKDQTFYRDQLAAFVGLGFLQASKLKEIIN